MSTSTEEKKINLNDVFSTISEPLRSILTKTSKCVTHPRTKGDSSEFQWLKWLKTYLPKRYTVDSGFVIDSKGYISEQQDIIIYDRQYSPYLLNEEGIIYVPSESVYGVIEVKQELNKKYLQYASEKIKSVRKLTRTSAAIPHIGGKSKPKKLPKIIGGLVCLKTSWKGGINSKFLIKALENTKEQESQIDIVCCLDKGAFITTYNNENITLTKSNEKNALSFFFLQLLIKLQEMATVPAIDFNVYAKSLSN